MRFKDMPIRGALIGAIVAYGTAVFPRGTTSCAPAIGDHLHRVAPRAEVESLSRPGADAPHAARPARSRCRRRRPRRRALLAYLSLSVVIPAAVAIGYGERVWPFLAAGAIQAASRRRRLRDARRRRLRIREGFLVVALTWLVAAALGALPYVFSGDPQLDRPVRRLLRGDVGFSTTGGSVVTQVEELPRSLLLWRQSTQWLGGIGTIVLALAVLPRLRVGGRQLLEHDMQGPGSRR